MNNDLPPPPPLPSKEKVHNALVQYVTGFILSVLDGNLDFLHGRLEKTEFRKPFKSLNNDLEEDSLQQRILRSTGSRKEIDAKRKKLQDASDRAFTLMMELLVGRGLSKAAEHLAADYQEESSAELLELAFWRTIAIFEEKALRVKKIKERVAAELEQGNTSFFIKLGKHLNERSEEPNPHRLNAITFLMAQFWVMPQCPLWMMNNEAGSWFVERILGEDVSAENYAQIIKRYSLPRFGRFPICGLDIQKDGTFTGFKLSRWIEEQMAEAS